MRGVDLVRRILDQWEENQKQVRVALERHVNDLEQSATWARAAFEGFDNSPVEDNEAVVMVAIEWQGRQKLLDELLGQLEQQRRERQEELIKVLGDRIEIWQEKSHTD